MNLTQALSLCNDHCTISPNICDRCSQPVAFLFNWDMVESLCMACFIEVMYEHNDSFPLYLKHVTDRQQLIRLLVQYQLGKLYFEPGPDGDPFLFFHPDEPNYDTQGGYNDGDSTFVRQWQPRLDNDQPGRGPRGRDREVVPCAQYQRGQRSRLRSEGGDSVRQQAFLDLAQPTSKPCPSTGKPIMVRELPVEERPVSRLHRYGTGSLSNIEIIASILQTPNALYQASTYLARHHGLLGLARASLQELQEVDGVGPAQSARLKAAMELGRRMLIASPNDRVQVKSPTDAANLMMMEMSTLEQEHMRLILLDSKNYVIDMPTMYVGSLNTSVIRIGELFREAIRQNCAAVIVVHNHPSGDPTPSPEDVAVTELIAKAGELLDIDVLDHLIIGQQRYVSLKERGLGFQ